MNSSHGSIVLKNGFWRENEYIALNGLYQYPPNVTLQQDIVILEKKTAAYHLWTTYFTKDMLIEEAQNAGFKVCGIYGDVTGTAYSESSLTLAVLLEK